MATAAPTKGEIAREVIRQIGPSATTGTVQEALKKRGVNLVKSAIVKALRVVREEMGWAGKPAAGPKPAAKPSGNGDARTAILTILAINPALTYSQAKPMLEKAGVKVDEKWYYKVRKEYQDARKKGAKAGAAPLGAKRQAVFDLLRRQHDIPWSGAEGLLRSQGVNISAEWFRRLKKEFDEAEGRAAAPATSPVQVRVVVPEPEPPAPQTPVSDAVSVARDLIRKVGKEDAVRLIEML